MSMTGLTAVSGGAVEVVGDLESSDAETAAAIRSRDERDQSKRRPPDMNTSNHRTEAQISLL